MNFLLQISNIVRSKDHLNISGEATTTWAEIHAFGCGVNFNAEISQLIYFSPVKIVSRWTVNLVHNHPGSATLFQFAHHFVEHWSANLGGCYRFLEPVANVQLIFLGIGKDGILLRFEWNTVTLFDGRNTNIPKVVFHRLLELLSESITSPDFEIFLEVGVVVLRFFRCRAIHYISLSLELHDRIVRSDGSTHGFVVRGSVEKENVGNLRPFEKSWAKPR